MAILKVWAIAANGGRVKIVQNLGSVSEQKIQHLEMQNFSAGELLNSGEGRVSPLARKSRAGMERHSDPLRNEERLFAEDISDYLLDRLTHKEFSALVVTGAPRTLGDLRLAFPDRLADSIIVELGSDFTQLSDFDLTVQLQALIKNK